MGLLLCLAVISLAVNGLLYQQNLTYKHHNRELILQNDSIISVNLELVDTLNKANRFKNRLSVAH